MVGITFLSEAKVSVRDDSLGPPLRSLCAALGAGLIAPAFSEPHPIVDQQAAVCSDSGVAVGRVAL